MKQCSKCLEHKALTDFYKKAGNKDGLASRCSTCCKKASATWRKNNPEKAKLVNANRYKKNPEKYKLESTKWQKENPDKVRTKNSKWAKANKEKGASYTQSYRTRKRQNNSYDISDKFFINLYKSLCVYCGSSDSIQADHVIPVSRGGSQSIGNLVPACKPCNTSKGAKTITEWKMAKRKAAN